ncbi:MAG: alpha/beta hydrolase [bacterium]|nr:alpha/beta hydrolase [bacterium]
MPIVTSHGVELYYETFGEGPAIVFAHGAGGNTLSWWQQVPHFARQQRVISFDHRGFGRSPCPGADFLPEYFADDLCAILDAESIERAALVCQSMGGWTGLQTAVRHPERVRCLLLGGTPAGVFTETVGACFAQLGARFQSEGVVANAAVAPEFALREPLRTHLYDQISALNPDLPPEGMIRLPASQIGKDDLEGYSVPTLMLSGHEDQLFSPEALREVSQIIPGAELLEFPGVGHSLYFEDPENFNRVLDEFLSRNP